MHRCEGLHHARQSWWGEFSNSLLGHGDAIESVEMLASRPVSSEAVYVPASESVRNEVGQVFRSWGHYGRYGHARGLY